MTQKGIVSIASWTNKKLDLCALHVTKLIIGILMKKEFAAV